MGALVNEDMEPVVQSIPRPRSDQFVDTGAPPGFSPWHLEDLDDVAVFVSYVHTVHCSKSNDRQP